MQLSRKTSQELKSAKKSAWTKDSDFRIANRKWLRYSSHVARRIMSAIEDKGDMNQSELARQIGVTPQYVSKIIQGRENLTLETIAKLSEALNVELISFPPYKHTNIRAYASEFLGQICANTQISPYDLEVGIRLTTNNNAEGSQTINTRFLYSANTTENLRIPLGKVG